MKQVKIARDGYILLSVIFYIAGIACILLPDAPARAAAVIGGWILILYGIIKIIGYFSRDLYCLAFQYDLACGALLILLGILVLAFHGLFQGYLLAGMGALMLLDSLLCIQTSLDARRFGIRTWWVILLASVLTAVLGSVLIVTGSQTLAGCALLAEGFMRQYIVQCTVHVPVQHTPAAADE